MYTVSMVYDEVCQLLLERGGLRFTYSSAAFLRDIHYAIVETCQRTAIVKEFFPIDFVAGTADYTLPDNAMDFHEAFAGNRHMQKVSSLYEDKDFGLDDTVLPQEWHRDTSDANVIHVIPPPSIGGSAPVDVQPSGGMYGTIGGPATAQDAFTVEDPLYGTLNSITGSYIESDGPFFGTISDITTGDESMIVIASVRPAATSYALSDVIPILPDTVCSYLKWFILEKIWSMDGEAKDIQRAAYATARKEEILGILAAIMEEDLPVE